MTGERLNRAVAWAKDHAALYDLPELALLAQAVEAWRPILVDPTEEDITARLATIDDRGRESYFDERACVRFALRDSHRVGGVAYNLNGVLGLIHRARMAEHDLAESERDLGAALDELARLRAELETLRPSLVAGIRVGSAAETGLGRPAAEARS